MVLGITYFLVNASKYLPVLLLIGIKISLPSMFVRQRELKSISTFPKIGIFHSFLLFYILQKVDLRRRR